MIVDLNVSRTVHRFNRIVAILRVGGEDHVTEFVPMARLLPQRAIDHLRRVHLLVPVQAQFVTDILLHDEIDLPPLVVPEHHTRRLFLGVEQIQRLADLAMVALLRFFQTMQVGLKLLLVFPGSTVDALQHLVVGVATPIGARHLHQFK